MTAREPGKPRRVVALVPAIALAAVSVLGFIRSSVTRDSWSAPTTRRVDLNNATRAELRLLPGVGPALAERIERDRAEHGPFASVDDLTRVRGIGPRTVLAIRPFASAGE